MQGGCFGGGTGIVAACDIVVASLDAVFSISEVRWGLHAGPILPQLAAAIGTGQLRRLALTGETFGAEKAMSLGLVHEICEKGGHKDAVEPILESILQNGPSAMKDTKRLIFEISSLNLEKKFNSYLAKEHAKKRLSAEASEGLKSFKEKRAATWSA